MKATPHRWPIWLGAAVLCVSTGYASAATWTWNNNAGGNWDINANWTTADASPTPVSASDTVLSFPLSSTTNGTYTTTNNVADPFTVQGIGFTGTTTGASVEISGGTLTFTGTGPVGGYHMQHTASTSGAVRNIAINNDLVLNTSGDFRLRTGGVNFTFNGNISGSGGLFTAMSNTNMTGVRNINLNGTNTYTGTTTIGGGGTNQSISLNLSGSLANSNIIINRSGSSDQTNMLAGVSGQPSLLNFNINGATSDLIEVGGGTGTDAFALLDITNLKMNFKESGLGLTESVYIVADYSVTNASLVGSAFAGLSWNGLPGLPTDYELQYNYNSESKIALVLIPEPASLVLAVMGGLMGLPRRRPRRPVLMPN